MEQKTGRRLSSPVHAGLESGLNRDVMKSHLGQRLLPAIGMWLFQALLSSSTLSLVCAGLLAKNMVDSFRDVMVRRVACRWMQNRGITKSPCGVPSSTAINTLALLQTATLDATLQPFECLV